MDADRERAVERAVAEFVRRVEPWMGKPAEALAVWSRRPESIQFRVGLTTAPWFDAYQRRVERVLAREPAVAMEMPSGLGMRGRDLWRDTLHRALLPDHPSPWEPLLELWRLGAMVREVRFDDVAYGGTVLVLAELAPDADSHHVRGLANALEWLLVPWGHTPPERHRTPTPPRLRATTARPFDTKVWGNRDDAGRRSGWEHSATFGAHEAEIRSVVFPSGAVEYTTGGSPAWVLGEAGAKAVEVCEAITVGGWAVQGVDAEGVTLARVPLPLDVGEAGAG